MPTPRTTTFRLTPKDYQELQQFYEQHQEALTEMGIDNLSKLIRWLINAGKPIVEDKLKKIEEK